MYVVEVPSAMRVLVGPFETLDEAIEYATAGGRHLGIIMPVFRPTMSALELVETPNARKLSEALLK